MITRRTVAAMAGLGFASRAIPAFAATLVEYWPDGKTWASLEPAAAGLDPQRLSAAIDVAIADKSTSVLVLRGGRIVAERYAEGRDRDGAQEIASAAKSMVSVLIGIAIDRGKIKSVDQSASDFITAWRGTPKSAITIRHMLTMTSGIDDRGLALRGVTGDQLALNAAAPTLAPPGTRWAYNTAVFHMLYHVVEIAAGQPFDRFAQETLIGPLGMEHLTWVTNTGQGAKGPVVNYYSARCSARDLARFGLFAQRGGRWRDRQLVSAKYMHDAISPSQTLNPSYGYLWWENAGEGFPPAGRGPARLQFPGSPRDAFGALGAGGQVSMVVPSLDLVVVRQGQAPSDAAMTPKLLASVCAAVRSSAK